MTVKKYWYANNGKEEKVVKKISVSYGLIIVLRAEAEEV